MNAGLAKFCERVEALPYTAAPKMPLPPGPATSKDSGLKACPWYCNDPGVCHFSWDSSEGVNKTKQAQVCETGAWQVGAVSSLPTARIHLKS